MKNKCVYLWLGNRSVLIKAAVIKVGDEREDEEKECRSRWSKLTIVVLELV